MWLFLATGEESYLDALEGSSGGTRSRFSWDDKYLGAQVLVSEVISFFIQKWEGRLKINKKYLHTFS